MCSDIPAARWANLKKMSNEPRRGVALAYAALVVSAICGSLGGLFIKFIPWTPLAINSARCFIALAIKIALRKSVRISLSRPVLLAGSSSFLTGLFFVMANKMTTSANAILLQYASPIFIILLGWIVFKKRPRWFDVLTSFVVIAGVYLCVMDGVGKGRLVGDLLALASAFTLAVILFVNAGPDGDPDGAFFFAFLVGAMTGLPWLVRETDFSGRTLLFVLLLGVVQYSLTHLLLEYGIRRVSALGANFVMAFEPILSPIWVAIFYGEKVGMSVIFGGILVIGAALVYNTVTATRAKSSRKMPQI